MTNAQVGVLLLFLGQGFAALSVAYLAWTCVDLHGLIKDAGQNRSSVFDVVVASDQMSVLDFRNLGHTNSVNNVEL